MAHSASQALSLSDALNRVSLHDERNPWGSATNIQPVPGINYPNQPRSDPSSNLSDPLTYWWGATLCPPELNDVALAETVVILMRYAALREVNLNVEVEKPSLANVLEFKARNVATGLGRPGVGRCLLLSLYQVFLFDWVVFLSNARNPCKLQLEEMTHASVCRDKRAQHPSSSTATISRSSKILLCGV